LGTVGFANSATYSRNGITISAPVTATYCQKATYAGGSSPYNADCRTNPNYDGDLFSWCMVAMYAQQLCPSPWRVPLAKDFNMYANGSESNTASTSSVYPGMHGWMLGGGVLANGTFDPATGSRGFYWTGTEAGTNLGTRAGTTANSFTPSGGSNFKHYGFTLRCVR
jgi:hypothetical protein